MLKRSSYFQWFIYASLLLFTVISVYPGTQAWAQLAHREDGLTKLKAWVARHNSSQPAPVGETSLAALKELMPPPHWREFQRQGISSVLVTTTGNYVPPQWFQAATEKNTQVTIGDGQLDNYVAGLPFPNLAAEDPLVAAKLMWNHDRRPQHRGPYVKGTNVLNISNGHGALSQ